MLTDQPPILKELFVYDICQGRMWGIILCDYSIVLRQRLSALEACSLQLNWLLGELLGDTCVNHRPSQLWHLTWTQVLMVPKEELLSTEPSLSNRLGFFCCCCCF